MGKSLLMMPFIFHDLQDSHVDRRVKKLVWTADHGSAVYWAVLVACE